MNITICGAGYVGLTSAACLANLGHTVMCVDIDESKIAKLKNGEVPFFEPGLEPLVKKNTARNKLTFTTDAQKGVEFGDVIFNCVGTPSKEDGEANLDYVFAVAKTIAEHLNNYKVIVIKSTVPPGTAKKTAEIIKENIQNEQSSFDVVSNPEFLREGTAIRAFNYPDKIVIGTNSDRARQIMRKVYAGRLRTYLPIVETDWETAELIKYANNTFLATKISFINEMANICDNTGADIKMVALALGLDYRIAPRFLNAGVGYGGSCFPKDVKAIAHTAKINGYTASLFEEVTKLNERQKTRIVEKILQSYNNNITNKTFVALGLSFKPKTSDMRDAPSINIINKLLEHGAHIRAYDPAAHEEAKKIFADRITFASSVEDAAQNADALILITEWDEFRNLDLTALKETMKDNKLFDGRNIYEPELVKEDGFEYVGMGRR
jgi:UDPglucose 6-dehydrogenase